jgi:hypothetical protein
MRKCHSLPLVDTPPESPTMSPMRTRLLLVVCVLLLAGSLSASATGILAGRVRDARTGEPLVGASVVINGTEYGNATDLKGDYIIIRLPEMTGTATAACVGYDDTSARFTTVAACTTHLDFSLHRIQPVVESLSRPAGPRPIPLPLPARSDFQLSKHGGCIAAEMSLLAIKQVGDGVLIQSIGPRLADMPNWNGPSIREGTVPIAEFRVFWDSLNGLGFWRLKDSYQAQASRTGEEGGAISASFEGPDRPRTEKTVRFFAPGSCSLEFRQVYSLFGSMARFAKSAPDWKRLVGYEGKEPIEGLKDLYHAEALQAIAVTRDSQDLDTLLSMLKRNDEYAAAVVRGLGSIGNRRAVPSLEEFLVRLDSEPSSWTRDYLIIDAAKALFAANGRQNSPAIGRFLSATYRAQIVYTLSEMLAAAGDYSGVPTVVEILSGPARGEVTWAAEALKQIGYGSQMTISALLEVAERELKADQPSDRVMLHTCLALGKLTGQEFICRPEDSLSVKRSNMAKWLKWWKANAERYPVGEGGPADGYGYIQVNSKPSGAAVLLDSTDTGTTTPFLLLRVAAGEHDVRLTKDRHADWSSHVTVTQGKTTTVQAVLLPVFGRLQTGSVPSGATIWLDGGYTGKTTPHLFAKVPVGGHRLRLSKSWHNYWDSTVTVSRGQMTIAEAMLKAPPESVWATYSKTGNPSWASWLGPERAVRFDPRDFGFGYPLYVRKVSAEFYLWNSNPWLDSSFSFKIYRGDGKTLLYQSPVLEAVPGPAIVHDLSAPVRLDSGVFYLSVSPVDGSGRPASLATSSYNDWRAPSALPPSTPADSSKRSYTGSPGHWSSVDKGEYSLSVLLQR